MTVTVTTAKSGRINIFADGEYRFTVPADAWYSFTFRDGDEITDEQLSAIKTAGSFRLAYESAVRMLGLRAHSEKELERKLRAKYGEDETQAAVEKCREYGFVNDASFAREFARELSERKNYAPARIKNELRMRGVPSDDIENALAELDGDDGGIFRALQKLHLPEEPTEKDRARAYRRLLSMGYSYSEASRALRSVATKDTDGCERDE